MRLWIFITIMCLAAALLQCLAVFVRVTDFANMAYKFGVSSEIITAGRSMVIVFFGATAMFVALGLLATDRPPQSLFVGVIARDVR